MAHFLQGYEFKSRIILINTQKYCPAFWERADRFTIDEW
jgi:hypothetical protein